jgi:predicted nucleic acid-binding protein
LTEALKGVHWRTVTDDMWKSAANMSFDLRRKGVTISTIDASITTAAMSTESQLLHYDSDYDLIARHTELAVFKYA